MSTTSATMGPMARPGSDILERIVRRRVERVAAARAPYREWGMGKGEGAEAEGGVEPLLGRIPGPTLRPDPGSRIPTPDSPVPAPGSRLPTPASDRIPDPGSRIPTPESPFSAAIRALRGRAVIAEVKMGSPTLGSLAGRVDPERQARLYADHGAACLSVVVDPDFFFGSYELLVRCVAASGLPAIAKDFVVDELQLDWAVEAGAAAILLVASLYRDADALAGWATAARARGLVPLVETHDAADVAKLGDAVWELVGVNNRDLTTFSVGVETSLRLAESLPPAALKVSESGIKNGEQVALLREYGYDAFLVGESLLLAADPAATLAELLE